LLISKVKNKKEMSRRREKEGREGTETFEGQRGGFRAGQRNCTRGGG
jgi:hypothetical protein